MIPKQRKGVVVEMIKNKEKIINKNTEKIINIIKTYVNDMDALSDTEEFTIDNIESRWGELEEYTKQVYAQINNEIVQQFNEKEIIQSKKSSTKRKV